MFNHQPSKYICPFCLIAKEIENQYVYTQKSDIVYRDKHIVAFIASHWWSKDPGHVIIIPIEHYENLYEIPDAILCRIQRLSKRIAIVLKEIYKCEGTTLTQHNEPAGYQNVWHYHLHIFPRWTNDELYKHDEKKPLIDPQLRKVYATSLKKYLHKHLKNFRLTDISN